MQKKWPKRNVDLKLLADRIGGFFKDKHFEAMSGETEEGYQIFAEGSPSYELAGYVEVTIREVKDDLSIVLSGTAAKRDDRLASRLTTFFAGGYFFLRSMRFYEEWLRFEKDFWIYADRVIENLSDISGSRQ
jgi:hypothetical protein